jgi:hypothetical protein
MIFHSASPSGRAGLLAAALVLVGSVGCGRTELFGSRRHCAPTDTVCQMNVADGGGGGSATAGNSGHGGSGGRPGVDGGTAGNGGNSGHAGNSGVGGQGANDGGAPDKPDGPVTCVAMLEICNNGKDDNCNGLADCQDPGCFGAQGCTKPGREICNNGLDDDDDKLVDCADPDCAGNLACRPTMGPEICDNGKDDNNDKLVDCADAQCTMFPGCLQVACAADVDFGAVAAHGAKVTRTVDTTGATRAFATCATPGGHGRVGRFVLTEAADVRLDFTQPGTAAHVVSLFRAGASQACDRNLVTCVNAGDAPSTTQTFGALSAGTYWLIVESFPNTPGATTVTLSTGVVTTPEQCANGKDDDGNGLIDCQDLACRAAANCAPVECKPDGTLGALVIGAPPKIVRVDLTNAPSRYDNILCAAKQPGGDAVLAFTLPEAGGVEVSYTQSGRTIIALFKQPDPGLACDDGGGRDGCSFEDQRSGAVAFSGEAAGQYVLIFKAEPGAAGILNLRISAFGTRPEEICANGIDDDGNGLVDCDDPTCFGIGTCGEPACTPDVQLGTLDVGTTQTTILDTRDGSELYHTTCGKGNGKDRVVRFSLTQPMALGIDCMDGGSHLLQLSQQLAPLDKCDAHLQGGCADPLTLPFGCGFEIPGLQPGDYNLIVEAFQTGSEGTLSLSLTGVAEIIREICDNGVDDDKDGATDCMDRKCVTSTICEKFACRPDKSLGLLVLDGSVVSAVVETSAAGDDQTQTACVSAGGGQDGVIDFQLPARSDLTLEWAQVGNHDFALYVNDGAPLSCEAGQSFGCISSGGQATGTKVLPALPAGRYHLVVDADHPGAEGGVAIQLSAKASP